ncbi:MAG: DUF4392 domain-containing protein [Clostridia bacterium]
MTQQELTLLNLGQNLDNLINLDPRGYGVCRILYEAAREYTGEPLTTNAAKQLVKTVKEGDLVYIITGFVLLPFKKAETDGIIGSMLFARALVKALNAKPVIICPEENLVAVKNLAYDMGLHLFDNIDELLEYPISMAVIPFTKDSEKAEEQADNLMAKYLPKAVVSIEAPGANALGVYHNATGLALTELQAKSDILFEKLRAAGVLNIAIGDLGNEIGMGTISAQLEKYVPYARAGACRCSCKGGIAAKSVTDHIITATVSDWGAYGLIAAIAYLTENLDAMHMPELEKQAMQTAARSGMIDMYGWLIPAIDGFGEEININIVSLMRECIKYPPKLKQVTATWFEKVLELDFFGQNDI